jgi:hypothetical protein
VTSQGPTLTFCGVNAHFQNGLAERRIRELTEHARTMLIHAQKRWPSAITANLWPYALRHANDLLNGTPNIQLSGKIPNNVFARLGHYIGANHSYNRLADSIVPAPPSEGIEDNGTVAFGAVLAHNAVLLPTLQKPTGSTTIGVHK